MSQTIGLVTVTKQMAFGSIGRHALVFRTWDVSYRPHHARGAKLHTLQMGSRTGSVVHIDACPFRNFEMLGRRFTPDDLNASLIRQLQSASHRH